MAKLRKAKGVREVKPGVFDIYASVGRDPLTGKYRQVSRRFHGTFKEAKVERAALVLEVNSGNFATRRVTVDELVPEWLKELEHKGRSVTTIDEYERRYRKDIKPAIGHLEVSQVTTKMLTDLYGAHRQAGAAPNSVRKIHATISSMMSQACRWGLRNDNPASWAEVPTAPPPKLVVPTPEEVGLLIEGAQQSNRPAFAAVIFLGATTGLRRGEICGLRNSSVNWDDSSLIVRRATKIRRRKIAPGESRLVDGPTKNKRERPLALDQRSLQILRLQVAAVAKRADETGEELVADPYIFTDSLDGSKPWSPDSVTQYFIRLRNRLDLGHISMKSLRAFMDTYGHDLGFTVSQVALRAGHDPSVASRHYIAKVGDTDRQIAEALAGLIDRSESS